MQIMSRRSPLGHLPLSVPVYQILLSLVDRDLHGYAIIMDIRDRTENEVVLTASTLYGATKRLLTAGLVRELEERPAAELDDARRRYYAITEDGGAVLRAEAARLERALAHARAKRLVRPDATA